jgi:repressor LexA
VESKQMKEMTERQLQVLGSIASSIRETGYPPTIREIGTALNIKSTNGVNDHLKALERKGYIARDDAKSRAVSLTATGWSALDLDINADNGMGPAREPARVLDAVSVPLLGRIAAGMPIDAIEHQEDEFVMDASLLGRAGRDSVYALRVRGDSMVGDAILDGDIVVIKRQTTADRGQIVAVMVDGAATVKRYYDEGERIRLQPSNPEMEPIYVAKSEARDAVVLGKVLAVYRSM